MRCVHFTILPASPCAADFYEIWYTRSTHWHNHVCQIISRLVQGLRSSDTPKIGICHWLAASPLQQCMHCRATLWSLALVLLFIIIDLHGWQWRLPSWQSITITEPHQLTTEPRLLLNAENISSETANIPVLGLSSFGHSLLSASVFICISKHWNSM